MKLKNKFAAVTGASTGIGRAIAIEFAKEGAFVALSARTKDRLEKTRKLIEKIGGKARVFVIVGTVAPTLLAHAFVPLMPRKGKILNISGTFDEGAKGWLPYYVSKRALEDLTVGLAEELEPKDIQVNCISPDFVATEAVKKFYSEYLDECILPEEVAKFAVYLCSNEADKITNTVFVMKKGSNPFEGFHT